MTVLEYIANLNRHKQSAIDRFGAITAIEREVLEQSYDWLLDNLDIKRGTIETDEQLSRSMDSFLFAVVDIIQNNKKFQGKVGSFLTDLETIQRNNRAFHNTTHNFNIQTAGVTTVQETVVNEIINQFLGNGLNPHFAAPLRDSVFRNILSGASIKDVKQVLSDYILGGQDESGKLQQYLHNTAIQAVDSYTGAINQQLKSEFDFTGYIISGSLIATSSKQCIYAIETSEAGYLSFKEWEKVLVIARNNPKARLIEGTTIDNLPLNKLHWGCRHDFTPVIVNTQHEEKPVKEAENAPEAVPVKKRAPSVAKLNAAELKKVEDRIRPQDFESAAVVKDGKLLFFKDGEASRVVFTDEEVALMNGAIGTHNHPGSRSFSREDVALMFQSNLQELRAVGRKADNTLTRTARTTATREEAISVYRKAESEVSTQLQIAVDNLEISPEEAGWVHHDRIMQIVSKKLHLKYVRTYHK